MAGETGGLPTFNELATEAGVGVGTVYRHFADAAALTVGLVDAQLAELEALLTRAKDTADAAQGLEMLMRGAVRLEFENPAVADLLATPSSRSDNVGRRLAEMVRATDAIVTRAQRAGVLRVRLRRGDFRRLVCGIERAARAGEKPTEAADRYVALVLAGLGLRQPRIRRSRR
jgi:AcrR family transcriptional regulator